MLEEIIGAFIVVGVVMFVLNLAFAALCLVCSAFTTKKD